MDPLVYSPRSASPPFLRGALQQGLSSSNILMFEPATYKPLVPKGFAPFMANSDLKAKTIKSDHGNKLLLCLDKTNDGLQTYIRPLYVEYLSLDGPW